ncbi:MAG TPA: thermonuclease family protein [Rhizomicrobium sp.]|nr:thermonuclease family protein [Rhizomicrobium sp.]
MKTGFAAALALACAAQGACATPLPPCAGGIEAAGVEVSRVEKNGALILTDGRAIHVEGVLLPAGAADHAPDYFAGQALNTLSTLTHGRGVTLTATPPKEDRYGRLRAQVFAPDNAQDSWIQVAMLKRGLARVSIAPDRAQCAGELYAAEAQARAARYGIWSNPAYAVRAASAVGRADMGTFQIVAGRVLTATLKDGRAFLDFGADWKTDFTVVISPADMAAFHARGIDPRDYAGKTVRVRGWLEWRDGPEIEAAVPEDIEVTNP